MNDLFRFIGKTEPIYDESGRTVGGYISGEVYMLELQGRGAYGKVLVTAPIRTPYDSWNTFLENWERI